MVHEFPFGPFRPEKWGAFHSTKISGNSGTKLEWNGSDKPGNVRKRRSTFRGGPLFRLVRSDRKSLFIRKNFGLQYLSVVNFWKFLSETEWNGSVHPGWYNHPENFPINCSIFHVKFSKFQTGIFGRMESAPGLGALTI